MAPRAERLLDDSAGVRRRCRRRRCYFMMLMPRCPRGRRALPRTACRTRSKMMLRTAPARRVAAAYARGRLMLPAADLPSHSRCRDYALAAMPACDAPFARRRHALPPFSLRAPLFADLRFQRPIFATAPPPFHSTFTTPTPFRRADAAAACQMPLHIACAFARSAPPPDAARFFDGATRPLAPRRLSPAALPRRCPDVCFAA